MTRYFDNMSEEELDREYKRIDKQIEYIRSRKAIKYKPFTPIYSQEEVILIETLENDKSEIESKMMHWT